MRGTDYTEKLLATGRCTFTTEDLVDELGKTRVAANAVIRRLRKQNRVATPVRGFHVVVPPRYRQLGCLPPQEFVPFLMKYLGRKYYAGLLTAASFHGAAHQQPQSFQILIDERRRDVECASVRIEFHERRVLSRVPVELINTDYGQLTISTPEATAIDLVGYAGQFGGLDRVATVLVELGEKLDGDSLREFGPHVAPDAWLQRLGYLLDEVGWSSTSDGLVEYVEKNVEEVTLLHPSPKGRSGVPRNQKWKVAVNYEVSSDL